MLESGHLSHSHLFYVSLFLQRLCTWKTVTPQHWFTGCFYGSSCLFGSKLGTVQGTMIQFSYSELQNATGKFSSSNLIGNGGSSYVYRGLLKDGRIVAVKRLKSQKGPDAESVFLTEVLLLTLSCLLLC